jgi:hypothetical protein
MCELNFICFGGQSDCRVRVGNEMRDRQEAISVFVREYDFAKRSR